MNYLAQYKFWNNGNYSKTIINIKDKKYEEVKWGFRRLACKLKGFKVQKVAT